MKLRVMILLAALTACACAAGWGGLSVTEMMVNVNGLADSLNTINSQTLGGTQTIGFTSPFMIIGGQGGGEAGIFSLSVWGGGLFQRQQADKLSASLGYAVGLAEPGINWKPVEFIELRPCLNLGGAVFNLELREIWDAGMSEDTTIYRSSITGWQANAGAAFALHVNVPVGERTMAGLMVKAGYLYPVYTRWKNQGNVIDPISGFGIDGPYAGIGVNFSTRPATHP